MEAGGMALAAALLLTLILTTALGGMAMVASIERRVAASHRTSLELRLAAKGSLALAAEELGRRDWGVLLRGAGSDGWHQAVSPAIDIAALTAGISRETMMAGAHGADTPVWQVFAFTPWRVVTGQPGRGDLVIWLADDWEERDGDPEVDSNGLILVRAAAFDGPAVAWTEALFQLDDTGHARPRHVRVW
jgi:hypothetical protein